MAQGKLTVWTQYGGPELAWLKQTAANFAKSSGTQVEVVEVPFGDIQNKFILGAPQGQAADLVVSIPTTGWGLWQPQGCSSPWASMPPAAMFKASRMWRWRFVVEALV